MTSADNEIATLERQCAVAMLRGDDAACAAILADDYTLLEVIEDRPLDVVLKDEWLKRLKSGASSAIQVDDVAVSMHGNVAIAVVKLTEVRALSTIQFAITDVWRKDSEWQLVERHQSRALAQNT